MQCELRHVSSLACPQVSKPCCFPRGWASFGTSMLTQRLVGYREVGARVPPKAWLHEAGTQVVGRREDVCPPLLLQSFSPLGVCILGMASPNAFPGLCSFVHSFIHQSICQQGFLEDPLGIRRGAHRNEKMDLPASGS